MLHPGYPGDRTPVLFNLYVNDLAGKLPETVKSHQYADYTTMYADCKPKELQLCETDMQRALNDLHSWSIETNLTLNASKTKTILFSTQQMSHVHKLENYNISLSCDGLDLERLSSLKLGVNMNEHLSRMDHVKKTQSRRATLFLPSCGNSNILRPFH